MDFVLYERGREGERSLYLYSKGKTLRMPTLMNFKIRIAGHALRDQYIDASIDLNVNIVLHNERIDANSGQSTLVRLR